MEYRSMNLEGVHMNKQIQVIEGGVTAASGYEAAGIYAGIKKKKKDMALVYTKTPAVVAGTFTTNVVKASPVLWDQKLIKEYEYAHGIVINSGVANACTGAIGDEYNSRMASAMAAAVGVKTENILTASTGVIGKQLPIEVIEAGTLSLADALSDTLEAGTMAAESIMTTDTEKKEIAVSFEINGKKVVLGGMSKGSGMIHPNMATMICVLTTDLSIRKEVLQTAMSAVVKDTFNMISVDRDTSTNDTFVCFANGEAENETITEYDENYEVFYEALLEVSTYLAKQMAGDGEGATKLIETTVVNAATKEEAKILAKSVITSNLVKAAVYGSDANCGRIMCAMGYSGVEFDPYQVDVTIISGNDQVKLIDHGLATEFSEEYATSILSKETITILCDLRSGTETATAWGCDLTYDYVKINADYRS